MIHLGLGAADVSIINIWNFGKSLVSLFLKVKCLSIISKLVVRVCDGLIAGDDLDVLFSEDLQISVKRLQEAVYSSLEVLKVLIHESEV